MRGAVRQAVRSCLLTRKTAATTRMCSLAAQSLVAARAMASPQRIKDKASHRFSLGTQTKDPQVRTHKTNRLPATLLFSTPIGTCLRRKSSSINYSSTRSTRRRRRSSPTSGLQSRPCLTPIGPQNKSCLQPSPAFAIAVNHARPPPLTRQAWSVVIVT